jgi:Protein of unknown function (DUF2934)
MKPIPTPIRLSQLTIEDEIRRRAYELYRGKRDGQDIDDWLQAEAEVKQKNNAEQIAA